MSDIVIEMVADEVEPADPPAASGKSRRPMILAAIAALALLGAGGAGYMFMSGDGGEGGHATATASHDSPDAYVEAPPMLVNLRTADGQARFLKLRFIIVAADAGKSEEVKAKLPVVLDALQPFLRELRPEDLNGSAAVFRVKEEMMVRAASAFGSGVVRDILIQDLVQQ